MTRHRILLLAVLILGCARGTAGQAPSQRGFVEGRLQFYPQETAGDRQVFADGLFRQEVGWTPAGWLTIAGAFDARADRDERVERGWTVDWSDRGAWRPALSLRRLSVAQRRGGLTVEAGKQLVRWGKADILNPTDRFAPRDFLEVVDADYLPVTAGRVMWERGANTIDLVVSRFTPSRIPTLASRWAAQGSGLRAQALSHRGGVTGLEPEALSLEPSSAAEFAALGFGPSVGIVAGGASYPSRPQAGMRWSHIGEGVEFSASIYDGFNHLPRFDGRLDPALGAIVLTREHTPMRMYGADAAWPLRWLTVKGEVGYFTSRREAATEYGVFVLQLERQTGEWFLVGGYAGEFVTSAGADLEFSPERGLGKTFLGRASYTIDANRSVAFEGAVRQTGRGAYLEAEFSQGVGQHWRVTASATLIRGREDDFLGQFRKNSNARVTFRYSY